MTRIISDPAPSSGPSDAPVSRCEGCGEERPSEELSAYGAKRLCRSCFPRAISLTTLRETTEHSPYLAFALSMLFPGAGHVYAGRVLSGYLLNVLVNLAVVGGIVGSLSISTAAYVASLLVVVALLPFVAFAIAMGATRLSRRVRTGELPEPASRTPLWVFLGFAVVTLGLVGLALVGSLVVVVRQMWALG